MDILARDKEIKLLEEIYKSDNSTFLAVYGRRRIGKTFLVTRFFKEKGLFFHITGTPFESTKQQLWNFARVFADVFNSGEPAPAPANWQEAFHLLKDAVLERPTTEKIILFFDELPWLANKKSGFLEALSYLWNRYLVTDPRIVFIVCGSAASWMINNIINSRGGLHNRITHKLNLQPFNLRDTEIYLKGKNIELSRKQIVEIYMAIGGVAAYLDMIKPGKSSFQVISEVCFDIQSPLHGEFERLFKSLFTRSELHTRVIKMLQKNRAGMSSSELFIKTGISSGSVQNRVKRELIESGFIAEIPFFGARKKQSHLRLIDEYSLFYLKWATEIKNSRLPVKSDYFLMLQNTPTWKSWSGYAFETICQNHIQEIADALGIGGIIFSYSSWNYKAEKSGEKGVQIDLIIDRPDNCINLCEIKFYNDEFVVSKEYSKKLYYKKQKFKEITKTRKTVFVTLITSYGVRENAQYHEVVNNQLTMDELFGK